MAAKTTKRSRSPKKRTLDEWERGWQQHWSKTSSSSYELPINGPGGADREFLTQARTPEKETARLKRIHDEFVRGFEGLYQLGPAVTVFGSARFKPTHAYYKLARAVGGELARAGFATLTGGGPGIMEAANRGAHEAGGTSYGLNIILPHEQSANPYVDKTVEFHYFFTRKVMLVKYSCAFIVMPGGLGTLDEMFEAATLVQCGKIGPFPIVLMGVKFWEGMRRWGRFMMKQGVFSKEEIGFGWVTDSPTEAVEVILRSLPATVRNQLKPRDGKRSHRVRSK
ncbi:MAG TPA: TIGR00730 family Rossman fold protein [Phycisphaerae bacterium]|nr:TIGR00730 family Rossman fold protein [Phycisphaerae bacterium]